MALLLTAHLCSALVFGNLKIHFYEESFILAEIIQSACTANSRAKNCCTD
jgi:hypothetical protein